VKKRRKVKIKEKLKYHLVKNYNKKKIGSLLNVPDIPLMSILAHIHILLFLLLFKMLIIP